MKTHIIIHHSLTRDSETVSWGAIRRHHTQTLGWTNIGYHMGIERIGDYYEVLMGRMPNQRGAHTREFGMNRLGLGICLVGNFDEIESPIEQFTKALELVRYQMDLLGIPRQNVLGHREVGLMAGYDWQKGQYKTCPGRLFDMDRFRAML